MKFNVQSILLLCAAIMAIVALCLPVASGTILSVPPGSQADYIFYRGGIYYYLETGQEYWRFRTDEGLLALGGVTTFLVIAGAAYVLITLLPRLRAGKTAFLGGALILAGSLLFYPVMMLFFEVENEVAPWDDILIRSFASLTIIPLILELAAAALAMVGGIQTWLNNRNLPR